MPIGETLAQARQQAGLTLAQVSRQTRIRETIIRKIEAGDFSECGGDFYARGHIRAIAKAVGTDSEPLIEEYDTRHREPGAMATVSLEELLETTVPQRRLPDLPAAWSRVTAASAPPRRKARPRDAPDPCAIRVRAHAANADAGPCSWAWRSWWWYSVSWRSTCWRARRPRHPRRRRESTR